MSQISSLLPKTGNQLTADQLVAGHRGGADQVVVAADQLFPAKDLARSATIPSPRRGIVTCRRRRSLPSRASGLARESREELDSCRVFFQTSAHDFFFRRFWSKPEGKKVG